jgi:Niemann-Pick C1 protein
LDSWYQVFRQWVDKKSCKYAPQGINPFKKVLEADQFKSCLQEWLQTDEIGGAYRKDIKFDFAANQILGWKQTVTTEFFEDPGRDALAYLTEIRKIESLYGLTETFSFERSYADLEIYIVLIGETIASLALAVLTVIFVVLFITMNLQVTFIVVLCVCLVDLYVAAFAHFSGLTLNNFTAIQLSFALGIAVDFSTHIAHTFLHLESPAHLRKAKLQREYKAKQAMSQMGSSVFHGGFSTFIAVSLMGFAKLYTFKVFFKTWLVIIVFGILNGIILLPILLSMVGPVE